jgi:hypothetical protein
MAKFGLFTVLAGDGANPKVTFEGDYIKRDNAIVEIWKTGGENQSSRLVGVIQVDLGEYMREL